MVNYQKGKIYKLISDNDDRIYIGSTCESLSSRMSKHRFEMNNMNKCKVKSQWMRDCGDVRIVLIKLHPCNTFEELVKEEEAVMKQFKDDGIELVNKLKAYTTIEEQKEQRREYQKTDKWKEYLKEYRKTDKFKEYHKEYRKTDKCKEYLKEYEKNVRSKTDKRKEWKKEYYKNVRSKPWTCPFCKSTVQFQERMRHQKKMKCIQAFIEY